MTEAYTSTVTTPATVRDFFAALAEFGTIIGTHPTSRTVTLYIHDEGTSESLGARLVGLGQTLGERGFAPAFPTSPPSPWGASRLASYRWEFDEPTYAGEDRWAILVPATDDVLHLFETITGLAAGPDTYAGEATIAIRLTDYDTAEVFEVVADMRQELHSWFGDTVAVSAPQPVA